MTGHAPAAVLTLSLFAYGLMAAIAMATAGLIALLVAGLAAARRAPAPAAVQPAASLPAAAIDPATVAAISAAVHVAVGGHRVVWIGETRASAGWTGEMRHRHHESHHPRQHR